MQTSASKKGLPLLPHLLTCPLPKHPVTMYRAQLLHILDIAGEWLTESQSVEAQHCGYTFLYAFQQARGLLRFRFKGKRGGGWRMTKRAREDGGDEDRGRLIANGIRKKNDI